MNPFTALIHRLRQVLAAVAAPLKAPLRTRVRALEREPAPQLDRFSTPAPSLSAAPPPTADAYHAPARMPDLVRAPAAGSVAHSTDRPSSAAPFAPDWASDRQWNRLFTQARTAIRRGDWLRYRDTRLEMAAFLRRRGNLLEALTLYLDTWYLDLNGPRDSVSGASVAMLGTEDPPFDPARAAPRSPARRAVRKLMHALDLQPHHVQALFLDSAAPTHRTLDLPLSPTQAWRQIGPELLF